MTGAGTNTYLLGDEHVIVIDPGPALAAHIASIERAAPGGIEWIVVTHTHLDHSPAAALLAERTRARVAGPAVPQQGRQDDTFRPDRLLRNGETVAIDGIELAAVATPGHASNHLCYWLASQRELFTGDHINEGSTVVINPPDGDMTAYLASLERLDDLGQCTLLPGHGDPIEDATGAIRALVEHRLAREAKVLASLTATHAQTIDELLRVVYADVDDRLQRVAARSLLAHLIKLERDGHACCSSDRWRRT
jgi:glyoxylase-like metal-dependent hydrolase (beta-lactamase superfamily II)